eukprot:m.100927 g.100927  ORF g.100927 m.100927 type:complete len:130 (-) comp14955_c1_seq7:67-456(-)
MMCYSLTPGTLPFASSSLFCLACSGSPGSCPPVEAFETLRKELILYKDDLGKRPFLIAANKVDSEEAGKNLEALQRFVGTDAVIPMAAASGFGVRDVTMRLRKLVESVSTLRSVTQQQEFEASLFATKK